MKRIKIMKLLKHDVKNGNIKNYWIDCRGNLRETKTDKILIKNFLKF